VRLLLAQAWVQSLSGQQAEAAAGIARAERLVGAHTGPLPDGFSSAGASLAALQGVFQWGDVRAAQDHAQRALELEGPGSPWHPVACMGLALTPFYRGELTAADAWFTEAIALAPAHGHWAVAASSLGCRSLIAGHEGRIEAQARLAEDAIALAREHGLEDNVAAPSLALGVFLAARGRPAEALPVLEHAIAVARFQGQPLLLMRALRCLAETLAVLGERDRAVAASTEARSILAACVDPAALHDTTALADRPARERGTFVDGPLTHRELTVLTLLAGDLSEAEIGRKLFVSHSTVHSHVKSIYRKLAVSTRAEALGSARAAGFV